MIQFAHFQPPHPHRYHMNIQIHENINIQIYKHIHIQIFNHKYININI
jgi:hypothetical protein